MEVNVKVSSIGLIDMLKFKNQVKERERVIAQGRSFQRLQHKRFSVGTRLSRYKTQLLYTQRSRSYEDDE